MSEVRTSSIHANTASVGQLHPYCVETMCDGATQLGRPNFYAECYDQIATGIERFRNATARLLDDASAKQLTVVSSTSDGLACILDAILELQEVTNGVIGINHHSFASVQLATRQLAGSRHKVIKLGRLDGRLEPHDLARIPNLRVLVLDWVNYRTGARNKIQPIAEYCSEWNIILVVDGVQGLGAVPLDFNLGLIDALACGCQKWLRGPEGTGLLYINESLRERVQPRRVGYRSLLDPKNFDQPSHRTISSDARAFEVGTQNTLGLLGAAAAVEALLKAGPNAVANSIEKNTRQILNTLVDEPDVSVQTPNGPGDSAGIVSFSHSRVQADELVRRLRKVGVVAARRGRCVRLSPASDAPMDALCERLKEVISTIRPQSGLRRATSMRKLRLPTNAVASSR